MGRASYESVADLMASLADGTRLRMLMLLRGGEMNVMGLSATLGVSQPTASHT